MKQKITYGITPILLALALLGGCDRSPPELQRSIPWSVGGTSLTADLHSHTTFSDGKLSVDTLVEQAFLSGCDVLAVTDHSDLTANIGSAGHEYFSALERARRANPGLLLLGGIEWNIPPHGGAEHVTVLLEPGKETELLGIFRHRFDHVGRAPDQPAPTAADALGWLRERLQGDSGAALFYNHPSRKTKDPQDVGRRLREWRGINHLFVGMEGAPGHQRSAAVGSYKGELKTINGWDPATYQVGGEWDKILEQGDDAWAALASSDFHNEKLDYLPCAYSRTHLLVPERSAKGVIEALRAGSFWADHGRLLSRLSWSVSSPSLPMAVFPAESARIDSGEIAINVALARDLGGQDQRLDVELIGNCASGKAEIIASKTLEPQANEVRWQLPTVHSGEDGRSCYLRLRVRQAGGGDARRLVAVANPIRLLLP